MEKNKQANTRTNQLLEATTKNDNETLPPELREVQKLGFDVAPSKMDHKAIILAATAYGKFNILRYFLAPERRPSIPGLQNTLNIALHNASKRYNISVVQIILENGADPNYRGPLGRTALHNAAKRGQDEEEVVRLLLEKGANIRAADQDNKTPLHLAGDVGNEGVFLMMHMHLYGNLSYVRRESGKGQLLPTER
jgi:ankyrin repeat protein